jgi:hypothetical protein
MTKLIELARHGRSWLQESAWSYLFGVGYFLMGVSALVSVAVARGSFRRHLVHLLLSAALALLIAKLFAFGYGGAARFRAARDQGAPWSEKFAELMPRLLVAQLRMDRAHMGACAAWLRRRPLAALAPGRRFGFDQRSSYATLIMLGLLSTLVDLPISTFMASILTKDPALQLRIHVIMGLLAVYSLIWLLGDRRLMQGSAHVLGASTLDVTIAGRMAARIPLAAIASVEATTDTAAAWCKRHGVSKQGALSGTPSPLDRPNVLLHLDPDAGVTLQRWQMESPVPRHLFLYLDEPSQFVAALRNAIECQLKNTHHA